MRQVPTTSKLDSKLLGLALACPMSSETAARLARKSRHGRRWQAVEAFPIFSNYFLAFPIDIVGKKQIECLAKTVLRRLLWQRYTLRQTS